MKVVLLHDWLVGHRGGERVLEALCELYPEAPIYTLIHEKNSTSALIESKKIIPSFLNKVPGIYKHYRKFLPLFPKAAESLHIEQADLVISSSHCVIKGVKKPSKAKHISYIHSPMRYIYDQFDVYFGKNAPIYQRMGAKVFRDYLTNWDLNSNENIDLLIANSRFVQQRIKNYYKKDSTVIHPFVDLKDFSNVKNKKEDYFVMVTAFAPNKRVDLAIEAFNKLGLPLRIIGSGQQEEELKAMSSDNISFLGNVSREEVIKNLSGARALIFPGVEDFGITPLEALASGTAVIAFGKGGVLETLNDDVAVFFNEASSDSLIDAIKRFELKDLDQQNLIQRAYQFSKESFQENIKNVVSQVMANKA
ncbi:MAG: glycosyltransferase [Bdellovibrionales bacterium]|nr:glycosyltransferase [Bdellovibrionales bacterium]